MACTSGRWPPGAGLAAVVAASEVAYAVLRVAGPAVLVTSVVDLVCNASK